MILNYISALSMSSVRSLLFGSSSLCRPQHLVTTRRMRRFTWTKALNLLTTGAAAA